MLRMYEALRLNILHELYHLIFATVLRSSMKLYQINVLIKLILNVNRFRTSHSLSNVTKLVRNVVKSPAGFV